MKYITDNSVIVEIGTGLGLISEFVFRDFQNLEYHSYEYDDVLADYLRKRFPLMVHMPCDGSTLNNTQGNSADIVIAFGVFTFVQDYNRYSYFNEMARVAKRGGVIIFVIFDADNFDANAFSLVQKKQLNKDGRPYLSGAFVKKYFSQLGCESIDDHCPTPTGVGRFLVLRKM